MLPLHRDAKEWRQQVESAVSDYAQACYLASESTKQPTIRQADAAKVLFDLLDVAAGSWSAQRKATESNAEWAIELADRAGAYKSQLEAVKEELAVVRAALNRMQRR